MPQLTFDAAYSDAFLGALEILTPSPPAAGAEISFTFPSGTGWKVFGVRFRFVTSAVVANRVPRLTLDDQTTEYFRTVPTAALPASQDQVYSTLRGGSALVQNGQVTLLPWDTPAPVVKTGYRLRSTTLSLDVGDQYSAIAVLVLDLNVYSELYRDMTTE